MAIIKKFEDGSIIERGRGAFDDWCVYLTRPQIPRYAPKDIEYFQRLVDFSKKYSPEKIYNDFVKIYNRTKPEMSSQVLDAITSITTLYNDDVIEMDILFTILYIGMVAEENKENTKLGKRIKRLGMHQILVDGYEVQIAANFSRNMGWRQISAECERRGF